LYHRFAGTAEPDELKGVARAFTGERAAYRPGDASAPGAQGPRRSTASSYARQACSAPAVDSRSRLQVVQKCSVIGEMMPKRRPPGAAAVPSRRK
jgi:hypothetical protein